MQNTYVALFIDHVQIIEKLLSARDFSGHGETTNIRRFPVTCHFHVTTPTTKQLMTSTFLVQHHHHHHPPSVQTRVGEIHEYCHDSSHQDDGLDENSPKQRVSKG
jgi:hypothetical protein